MVDYAGGLATVSAYAGLSSLDDSVLAATFLSVPETFPSYIYDTIEASLPPRRAATPPDEQVEDQNGRAGRDNLDTRTDTAEDPGDVATFAQAKSKKKYKPVALKTRPVLGSLPDKFRIVRDIKGDPLATERKLSPNPPPFKPEGRYTAERAENTDKLHNDGLLLPAERDLLHHFMSLNNEAFAWSDAERGNFKSEYFPPIDFPVIPHTPWVQKNIPIPPGLYHEVCKIIRKKIDSGVYEPSNSSYRSRWFCVVKKDGKSLRLVHSLEPLNAVTIQHSGVPPIPEHLAEEFGGRACGAMLDLFVGYDERYIAESSRDLTTFQTPYGAMRLTTLPMGWTNAVPIFHDDVTYILQPEIPEYTIPYIDDVPGKGPATEYDGERIPENPGIRRFVWEHFQNLSRIVTRMRYAGGTFSGVKSILIARETIVIGHRCTPEGRKPDESRVAAIRHWGPCQSLSDVRAFLGTIGVCRIFIKNFAHRADSLTRLTRKDVLFEWGPEQQAAQDDLKSALLDCPALRAIKYQSESPVILAVDTSYIAVGYLLCQCDEENPKRRFFNRFGSITLNDRERRFSQPKLEIYGLFRALRALRLYLVGIRNLVIEVDARYIKGMLQNPDVAPSASINRWIVSILMFHFTLVHVPGTMHGPDGLSRRPRQPDDIDPDDADDGFDDWIDNMYSFMHMIQPALSPPLPIPGGTCVDVLALTEDGQDFSKYEGVASYATSIAPDDSDFIIGPDTVEDPDDDYTIVPRSNKAQELDARLPDVQKFLETLVRPKHAAGDKEFDAFYKYAMQFGMIGGRLWRKDPQGAHKLVIQPERRLHILRECHDKIGHRGIHATIAAVAERFWWPELKADAAWYVRSCDLCQKRQLKQVLIPPTVAPPAGLFVKAYMDTMFMPKSGTFKLISQARCSTIAYLEARKLRRETGEALGMFIYEDLLCRWGTLAEIVTDNGAPWVKALDYLSKRFHINHIRISSYNSRANGIVERAHFDMRQALFKAADGDQSKWSQVFHSVVWSDRVTAKKRMGCSPYFAATGTHPILPLDVVEATWLAPPPDAVLSTTDLVARRAIALQKRSEQLATINSKVYEARREAARRFEQEHQYTIRDFDFQRGDLVLLRNTAIEKALNRKMRARYLGPMVVISRNRGGAYLIAELDGTLLDRPIAAFRVIPYLPRRSIHFDLSNVDVTLERLREMEQSDSWGDDDDALVEPPGDAEGVPDEED